MLFCMGHRWDMLSLSMCCSFLFLFLASFCLWFFNYNRQMSFPGFPISLFFQVALGSINVISGIDFHLLFSVKLLPLIKIWISLGLVLWPSSFVTLSIYYLSEMQFSFIPKLDYLQVCCEHQIRWWERA